MSIIAAIFDHLTSSGPGNTAAIVSTRVYLNEADDSATRPYVVYQEISSPSEHHMTAAVGLVNGARWQFTCVADNAHDAFALGDAVRKDLDGLQDATFGTAATVNLRYCHLDTRSMGALPSIDADRVSVHTRIMEFLLAYVETVPTF